MKRFFISAIVIMSCFMANAQTISIPAVNLAPGGEKTVNVSLANATDYTAFQFDIALPTGVTITNAVMDNKPATREIKTGTVNGKYRVLSYDNGNAKFNSGSVLSLTFKAADAAATNATEAEVSTIVVVKDDGNAPDEATGSVAINVIDKVSITVGVTGKSTLVSDTDLDFSTVENLNAYIATGYDKAASKIWLTRVKDVPAGTPVMLIGPATNTATTYEVPVTNSTTYYPKNYLKGSATSSVDVNNTYFNMALQSGTFSPLTDPTFPKGKCYLELPTDISATPGGSYSFDMGKTGRKSYVSAVDLDFDNTSVEDLIAYTVTGYSKSKTIWLTRVKKVSAGTPLYLVGTANKHYEVPSVGVQSSYINMLKGDAANSTALTMTSIVEGINCTNCVLQGGSFTPLQADEPNFPAKTCYLPIPTSYIVASARGTNYVVSTEIGEAEVISLSLSSIGGDNDDTTGIRSIGEVKSDDAWYNLKGQRIDTPTKKGLYIKNGRKVVVK